ncbi:hypothetical protein NIES2100_05560 [Calothrix sp. NIES-2100]|uniref:hypothetical protein n=1 Tax=Calothrix sp. NIES-2100 TaxID=1954172 RepID=UPI000B61F8EE|nr:hypothetical protein NIES2100_05560 [Calothrix sp. NIES-2100]
MPRTFYETNAVIQINQLIIEVSIKLDQNTRTFEATGIENERNFFVGNVVNSNQVEYWLLPSEIQNGTKTIITIDNNVQGDFIFQNVHRTRFKELEKIFGQTFKGSMIPKKSYSPNDWS